MGKVHQPRDLLLQQLADLLFVERRLVFDVLPGLLKHVQDEQLARGMDEHLEQTKTHVANVESVFRLFEAAPSSNLSAPLEGLASQYDEHVSEIDQPVLRDLFNAAAAAHTEHYEIASYRVLVELADALEASEAVHLLEQNLKDEEEALAELEKLSKRLAKQAAG
jgi:ferritin-like metal-binding protein YciE